MEFFDMNLTNDSSLLLHAIHSLFYWRILHKTILYCSFKTPDKKFRKKRNLGSIHQNFVELKNQTKTRVWEDSSLCTETSTKTVVVQEFHLRNSKEDHALFCCRWNWLHPIPHSVNNVMLPLFPLFKSYSPLCAGRHQFKRQPKSVVIFTYSYFVNSTVVHHLYSMVSTRFFLIGWATSFTKILS